MLYYYCDQPSSFSQAPSACGVQCSTERLVEVEEGLETKNGNESALHFHDLLLKIYLYKLRNSKTSCVGGHT